jgi:hypothetical protein
MLGQRVRHSQEGATASNMRIASALWLLPLSGAVQASDIYLACNFSDGLRSNLAIVTSAGRHSFHEGSMSFVEGEKDPFGGLGSITETATSVRIEYAIGSLQIVTTIWSQSWQLLELTNRSGAETYRSAQCAPTEPWLS